MPNCGFREGTHRNRRVTHSANERSGERETGCALGMCAHSLRFGSLALRLFPGNSNKVTILAEKKGVLDKGDGDACPPMARQTGMMKKMKVKELLFPL